MLRPVGESGFHESACWLPSRAAGLSEQAEELREETVREGRGEAAAEVAEAAAADVPGAAMVGTDGEGAAE